MKQSNKLRYLGWTWSDTEYKLFTHKTTQIWISFCKNNTRYANAEEITKPTQLLQNLSPSSSFGFSHQGSPQRIFHLQLLLSSISSSVTSTSAMSSFTTSFLAFPVSSFLATPSSASFSQYTHHLSSVHVHTTSVSPLVFLSKPSHLCCPSDVLIPDFVHSCHS